MHDASGTRPDATPTTARTRPSTNRLGAWMLAAVCLLLTGCAVPPGNVTRDRFDYGETLAESWKRQTLVNIVRLRYADAPLFMDITSVINSYSRSGKLSASGAFPPSGPFVNESISADGAWSNTPTVTYQPLGGDKFTRSLLRPIPPGTVIQMLQAGWPAELIFRLAVRSANNISNRGQGDAVADAKFDRMLQALDRIVQSNTVGLRLESSKDGETSVIVIRRKDAPGDVADINTLRELWNLDAGATEITVTYGAVQRNGSEVAMLTRSMLEIMLAMALDIDVPSAHLAEKRVLQSKHRADDPLLIRVYSGKSAPADAFAAVPYKDHWFWIDDTDVASKTRFTFLMILSSLAETGNAAGAPVVTVPSR